MNPIVLSECPLVRQGEDASLLDLGDGIACLRFESKGNSITPTIKDFAWKILKEDLCGFDGLVVGSQAKNFSVGANLNVMKQNLDRKDFETFRNNVRIFQDLNMDIKYYHKPIVAAPYRNTLGGGLELSLHCHKRVAQAKSYMGLVEVGVGLLPGGGGTKECALLIGRASDAERPAVIQTVFEKLLLRKVSASADDARNMLYLSPSDGIEAEPELLVAKAKAACLELVGTSRDKREAQVQMPGAEAYRWMASHADQLLEQGKITPYDREIGLRIATVLAGGNAAPRSYTERQLLELECDCFLDLLHQKGTYDRISHFVATGELLRN